MIRKSKQLTKTKPQILSFIPESTTMTDPTRRKLALTTLAIFIINLHLASSAAANTKTKPMSRPVHEIISEQNRPEVKVRTGKAPLLPYGNPLAGNSQKNARIHAQNQQAMFNAERVRQHRAQLQRLNKAPPQMDSYMKAYHESQENHQFALEQQQTKLKDDGENPNQARGEPKRGKAIQTPELTKITKDDAVTPDKARSHRSFGSDHRHFAASQLQSVYVSPAPEYDQGVTIKPNGNVGINHMQKQAETMKLFTQAVPSETHYIYPKQYSQMQQYQSSQDIDALNSLLKKNPQDQLSQLNVLLESSKENSRENTKDGDAEVPIDLYFYLKDNPAHQALTQEFEPVKYTPDTQNYPSYLIAEDPKPIREEIDDIADPNVNKKYKYNPRPTAQPTPERQQETTTTKSHNYYKVEVASQTITSAVKPIFSSKVRQPENPKEAKPMFQAIRYTQAPKAYFEQEYTVSSPEESKPMFQAVRYTQTDPAAYISSEDEDKPKYQVVSYEQAEPETYIKQTPKYIQDQSELYMHHNAQFKGVQHLSEDGSVTAYSDDGENVSSKNLSKLRTKRYEPMRRRSNGNLPLETNAFLIPNKTLTVTETPELENEEISTNNTATAEALRLRLIRKRKPFGPHNTFLKTPEFPIGEALDISTDYDYDVPQIPQRPKNHKYDQYDKLEAYDDTEDDYEDYVTDFSSPDDSLDIETPHKYHPVRTYAPNNAHYNQNVDLKTSFSSLRKVKRHPNIHALLNSEDDFEGFNTQHNFAIPHTSYGIPQTSYGIPSYGLPQTVYSSPLKLGHQLGSQIVHDEPVYMLTETQLKNLVGHHNLNIEHLDVFQIAKGRRRPPHPRPKKGYRGKRYPHGSRPNNLKKNLYKLNRLLH